MKGKYFECAVTQLFMAGDVGGKLYVRRSGFGVYETG